ncbi:hypothetical protein CAG54_11060 [Vibrio sp. V27_P1S3P104]|uniref:hypothetical protein n=1 Tax=unclassified Vibrio TaxID=2614977 RepID=UPI001372BB54|nr:MULTISPECIES: hypothetical protein [unclassified Vibrio]NAX35486.1 hypothetical protein [Vibrio sp. V29_P1S30P107]NAX38036.1 hypothetical protein [Vibrio sp. V27_P1S3P104]
MSWLHYLLVFLVVGAFPALLSICYLLPKAGWSTRLKIFVSRGFLKFPFGVMFGFSAIFLPELFYTGVVKNIVILFALSLSLFFLFTWFYLYLYKLMLNRLFLQSVTWKAIINSVLIEIGLVVALVSIGTILALVFAGTTPIVLTENTTQSLVP